MKTTEYFAIALLLVAGALALQRWTPRCCLAPVTTRRILILWPQAAQPPGQRTRLCWAGMLQERTLAPQAVWPLIARVPGPMRPVLSTALASPVLAPRLIEH